LVDREYQSALRWVTQALVICADQRALSGLWMDLAFILSRNETVAVAPSGVTAAYCIERALSIAESKEILFARAVMLCEADRLEAAGQCLDRLLALCPADPQVAVLKALLEHLAEETEDAQKIWQQQLDAVREAKGPSLWDRWRFSLRTALHFNCPKVRDIVLTESEPFFQGTDALRIEFALLLSEALVFQNEHEAALSELGRALLIDGHDQRLWLHIGCTYFAAAKWTRSMEALQRHITECSERAIFPNVLGMFLLIEIYLMMHSDSDHADDGLLERAESLIDRCRQRIDNGHIFEADTAAVFGPSDHRDAHHLAEALEYKLRVLRGVLFSAKEDAASALSLFANASRIHPFDERLWDRIEDECGSLRRKKLSDHPRET